MVVSLEARVRADGYEDAMPVLFYGPGDEYGFFSNFSPHNVVCRNPWTNKLQVYRTSEHRFHAMKAIEEEAHDWVALAPGPFEAKERGGPRGIELRPGWGDTYGSLCYYVMLEVCMAKALQHDFIAATLTDELNGLPIYEDSPWDDIWGVRDQAGGYSAKNLLGRVWMQVREDLRQAIYF